MKKECLLEMLIIFACQWFQIYLHDIKNRSIMERNTVFYCVKKMEQKLQKCLSRGRGELFGTVCLCMLKRERQ